MATEAVFLSASPKRRFNPGQMVVTSGVDALIRQGRLNPTPVPAPPSQR